MFSRGDTGTHIPEKRWVRMVDNIDEEDSNSSPGQLTGPTTSQFIHTFVLLLNNFVQQKPKIEKLEYFVQNQDGERRRKEAQASWRSVTQESGSIKGKDVQQKGHLVYCCWCCCWCVSSAVLTRFLARFLLSGMSRQEHKTFYFAIAFRFTPPQFLENHCQFTILGSLLLHVSLPQQRLGATKDLVML